MEPNEALSNKAYIEHVIEGSVLEFGRLSPDEEAILLHKGARKFVISLKGNDRTKSREKYGSNYIGSEVSVLLLKKHIFHFHTRVLIRNISEKIFEDTIAIYVRP